MQKLFLTILFIITCCAIPQYCLYAQQTLKTEDGSIAVPSNIGTKSGNTGNKSNDSTIQHRNDAADSLTIFYRWFNNLKINYFDSALHHFTGKEPLPNTYINLGNTVTPANSLVFNKTTEAAFNAGFHQFDVYNYNLQNTRLFETTKPFTQLGYMLGKNAEQLINVLHTQNKNSNLNFSIEYRFVNSPGVFKNQNASINNLRFVLQYQSPNKRYHLLTTYITNKNAASENGGTADYKQLDSLTLNNPFEVAVRLGPGNTIRRNLFNTSVYTGNIYKNSLVYIQNQYDFGQKDSLVKDTTVIRLFYPRLRVQHSLAIAKSSYQFIDMYADSSNYEKYFGYHFVPVNANKIDTVSFTDEFKTFSNEFSAISYPDKRNAAQYIKASATIESIVANYSTTNSSSFTNIFLSGAYKNRTKNKVWDIDAQGKFYLSGYNAADYDVNISLQKLLSHKSSSLQVGFGNSNSTPSFIFNNGSNYRITNRTSYNKENTTKIWGSFYSNKYKMQLQAEYYLLSNYLYFDSFFTAQQEATLFNVIHISAEKKFKLSKYFNWYTQLHVQQATANAPINIPAILSNNTIAFEGNFYKNLFLATGLEIRYHNNYKPANYSPFIGQFFYQTAYTTSNKPNINFFFNFRVKTFKGYFRVENLNTLLGTGYKAYNYETYQYPSQNMWLRFGIWWNFVN